jgi:hypothetical protein
MTIEALIDQWRLHPSPEVGSCANQLAGWLRTQEVAPVVSEPPWFDDFDDQTLCAVCGWTLADNADKGCVRGNCSMRPLPERAYAPERANAEYGGALAGRYGIPAASRGGGDTRPPRQDEKP